MLNLRNIKLVLKKNSRVLLENFNFSLNPGDKVAIIGEEGNGKSTLLKLIFDRSLIDEYCEFTGEVSKKGLKIGYLEQILNPEWNEFTINDYFLKDSPSTDADFDKYEAFSEISSILSKFHMDPMIVYSDQKMKTLSGGEKVKIQLAKIVFNNNDILLLDEPTNDLDIETLKWLENFINTVNIPIIFISHDETLLENTANTIIHIEQLKRKSKPRHTIEKIDYRAYVEKRLGMLEKQGQIARKQRADHQKQMEAFQKTFQKVAYQQDNISRSDPHGAALLKKKMKSLKSQERRYEREKEDFVEVPNTEDAIFLDFENEIYIPTGKKILDMNIEQLKNFDRSLSTNIELSVYGPEHIVIVGTNGVGKTTLMKKIYKDLSNRKDIKVGYMPQNYEDILNLDEIAVDFVKSSSSKEDTTKAMTYLGSLKFTTEEMRLKIGELSGGQRAKLLLLKLVLSGCDVLLLDEPTRNLSPLSNPVIRSVLSSYTGAIISVSHDRKYIDEVCDKLYFLTEAGLLAIDSVDEFYNEQKSILLQKK